LKPAAKSVNLGREELYELVWSEPMVRLAKRFALTDVALAKTCKRMGIPVPPRGYWRRKETGYRVGRPALPPLKHGMTSDVELQLRESTDGTLAPNPEVEAQRAFEAQPENRIVVARRLASPHPLVERTRLAMALAKPGQDGCLDSAPGNGLDIRVTPKLLPRALRIMDAFVKAVEARGGRVSTKAADQRETRVEFLGEQVPVLLEERVTRTRHVLTEAEQRHPYQAPRWDYAPTGKLRIQLNEWTSEHLRKRWADSAKRGLEDVLNDIVLGLVVVAGATRRRRLQREREERERQEAELRRIEAERQRREELERRQRLERQVESWTKAQQVRAFVEEVERRAQAKDKSTEPGSELAEWIAWARRHADRLDPLKPPGPADGTTGSQPGA
jgi:hypothetical protein